MTKLGIWHLSWWDNPKQKRKDDDFGLSRNSIGDINAFDKTVLTIEE